MLLLYRTDSTEFAHDLVDRLVADGIPSRVTGDLLKSMRIRGFGLDLLSVWIERDSDLEKARLVLREQLGTEVPEPSTAKSRFMVGLVSAVVAATVAFTLVLVLK